MPRSTPLVDEVLTTARDQPWVQQAAVRIRDQGHVFHTEVFVRPTGSPSLQQCDSLAEQIRSLDWKLNDVVVAPVSQFPDGARTQPRDGKQRRE